MNSLRPIWLGAIVVVLLVAAMWVDVWSADYAALKPLANCLYGLTIPVTLGALLDGWMQFREQDVWVLQKRQEALSMTATGYTLRAAQGVHPEVIEQLFRDRARRWGLVSGTKSKDRNPYSVLIARPVVTDRFLVHFLRMSNQKTSMAKRLLSDGDKRYDPAGIVTAYEMYDALQSLLEQEMKVTRPFGDNRPGYWLNDWTPETVAMDFGIRMDDYEYENAVPDLNDANDDIQNVMRDVIPLQN